MNKLSLFSPAKLNLFFRVLRQRPDGFHDIASLYQAINFGDHLTLSLHFQKDTLSCTDPTIPLDESNLVIRAAHLFRKKTATRQHFSFHIEKKIPSQAGLGGGSSNAATTLWGLNQLMNTKLSDETLASWAIELGSDVPFFFTQGRALVEGRGEQLTPQYLSDPTLLWIAKPKEGLSTRAVYQKMQLNQLEKRDPKEALAANIYFNDLEVGAFQLMPKLKEIKQILLECGFNQVQMTGSGTAFFCFGDVDPPKMDAIDFYPTQFHSRTPENWYKFPS